MGNIERDDCISPLRNNGYFILQELTAAFSKNNIQLVSAFGTLLGFVRDKDFIEYDKDIDFMLIDDGSWTWESVETIMAEKGYERIRRYVLDSNCTGQSYIKSGCIIDIFKAFFEDNSTIILCYHRKDGFDYKNDNDRSVYKCKCPIINGFKRVTISDFEAILPCNDEEVLAAWYGDTWRIPDRNFTWTGSDYCDSIGKSIHF